MTPEARNRCSTLISALRGWANSSPDRTALQFLQDGETSLVSVSYADLYARSQAIGWGLSQSCSKGSKILLICPERYDYLAALYGCFAGGMTAVSGVPPHLPRAGGLADRHARRLIRFLRVAESAGASAVLGPAKLLKGFRRALEASGHILNLTWLTFDDLTEIPAAELAGDLDESAIAFIQYTSGSTGSPKGVVLDHRTLIHNLQHQERAYEYTQEDFGVSWLPFFHDMGLIGSGLSPLYTGYPCLFMTPEHFIEKPVRWIRAISNHKATLSWAPNFAYSLCAQKILPAEWEGLDLSAWRMAANSAEPISPRVLTRFEELFRPYGFSETTMQPCYGLAEATLLVTSRSVHERWKSAKFSKRELAEGKVARADARSDASDVSELVACGLPAADGEIAILSLNTGNVCAPDEVGEIVYQSPSVANGFYGLADETTGNFQLRLPDGRGPFLRTGDLGFFYEGDLYIAGRSKDLIMIRGVNYYPQDIEQVAEASHSGIREGSSAAFSIEQEAGGGEALIILCEVERGYEADADNMIAAVRRGVFDAFELDVYGIALMRVGMAFKTPSGKIQRRLCRQAYVGGELPIIASWRQQHQQRTTAAPPSAKRPSKEADVAAWLLRCMLDLGGDPRTLSLETHWSDMDFNSVRLAELGNEIDEQLGVDVPLADLFEFGSAAETARHLWSKLEPQLVEDRSGDHV